MGDLFFGVAGLDFENGSVYEVRDVSDLSTLADTDGLAVFSHYHQVLDRDV